jgi:hypothetical protein
MVEQHHEDIHRQKGVVGLSQRGMREVLGRDEQALEK